MANEPITSLSATTLAKKIRAGELGSRDVVEAHIARIERVNGSLNAVVERRYAEARAEADAADARIARGDTDDLPPLWGVPCTIKECFALTGMPNTAGLVARQGQPATSDATAVARLRSAGAIPLGVTNTSELCMWMESHNRVYGRTGSAYDPKRTAGGSSGGEGSIVGAGGSPFGLGSDIGGSIRMPAFFNGVFGHKPSAGLVPGTGQYPIAHGAALRYLTTGPLCRRAEDLLPLLRILAGPDGHDAGCEAMPIGDPASVRLGGLRVLDVPGSGLLKIHPELRVAQEQVTATLRESGARVEQQHFPALRRSLQIWSSMLSSAGGPSFAELLGNGTPVRALPELVRLIRGTSPHTLPAVGLVLLEKLPGLKGPGAQKAIDAGHALRDEIVAALTPDDGSDAVLLYPSYPEPAPCHGKPLLPPIKWMHTAIFNVLELPVTQVPLGLSRKGLPLGVQVVGAPGKDHVTIAVALELERRLGGWVEPPNLPPLM